ncbi:MAG: ABC transporter ATP-binding protein [Acidimicrobiia bacterium]
MAGGVDADEQLDRGAAVNVIRRTYGFLAPYRGRLVLAGFFAVLYTASTLAGPLLVRTGIDDGIKDANRDVLNRTVMAYVIIAALGYVVYRRQVLAIARIGEDFLKALRIRVFDHLQRLSMPFYDREKAGVVVSRMTSDIDALSELVQMGLLMFVQNGLLLVVSIGVLFYVSPQMLGLCLVAVPGVVIASRKFQRDSNEAYLDVRDGIGATLSQLQEGISGVRVVQAFAREDVQTSRFEEHNRQLYDAHMRSVKISAWYLPVIEIAGLGTTALAVGVGGWWVHEGDLTIGTVTFFVLTLSNLFEPIQQLSQLFNMVQSAGAGLQKLYGLLDTEVDVPERPGAVDVPARGAIEVRGVGFHYASDPDTPVLRGVDLTVHPGERLALVGPTGAGKSTLAKLIVRFYDPTEGSVSIGGLDVRDATLSSLRRTMVVVPQEGFLFNGTLMENVRLSRPDASDDQIVDAMDSIGILHRFAVLPDGLHTEVRERGSRFSAGEKQLISLARAALADPEILVLDEATSSLDPGTEAVVEEAMDRLSEGRTTIVIAHRLTTAARADRVAVVAGGSLAEVGTHEQLIAAGGHYAALFSAWAGGQPV